MWKRNLTDLNKIIFKNMAKQIQKIKMSSKEKYWIEFAQTLNHETPIKKYGKKST